MASSKSFGLSPDPSETRRIGPPSVSLDHAAVVHVVSEMFAHEKPPKGQSTP